jgi:flagellar motor switch protein FliN
MSDTELPNLDRLLDVPISVAAEMASTKRTLQDILRLKVGEVLVLETAADTPVNLYANGKLIGRGEIVVNEGCFGIQVTELKANRTDD